MRLICNNKAIVVGDDNPLKICPDNIGCSTYGDDAFYDLGFNHEDVRVSDFVIEVGEAKIVIESQTTKQNRMVKQFMEEFKTSDFAAKYLLQKAGWNYAQASLSLRMAREAHGEQKQCGEIPLGGPMESCNLQPITIDKLTANIRSCFPALPSTPLMAKDEPSFMPKTAAFQAQDRIHRYPKEKEAEYQRKISEAFANAFPAHTIVTSNDGTQTVEPGMMIAPDFCKCSYPTYDHVTNTSGTCGECGRMVCQAGMEVDTRIPEGYYRLMKDTIIQPGDRYLSTTGTFQDVTPIIGLPVPDNDVVFIRALPNPCAVIPPPKLNWECACQNGMVGPEHCRVHGNNIYGQLHPDAVRILKGESTGHFCWNYPPFSQQWWEVKPGWLEPRIMVGGKSG